MRTNVCCFLLKLVRCFLVVWIASTSVCHAGVLSFPALLGDDSDKQLQSWLHAPTQELKLGEWDRIRIVPSQSESPNQHPLNITNEQVADMLKVLMVDASGDKVALFSEDEIKRFSKPIALALSIARPDQDLEFLSTGQHGMIGIVAPVVGNAGRIFVADGRLNVILGMMHKDFISDYLHGSRRVPKFDYGSQKHLSEHINLGGVVSGNIQVVRQDWVALPIVARQAERKQTQDSENLLSGEAAPTTKLDSAEDLANKLAIRLKALQLLKEQGLLSAEEYRDKRAAILQGM